jgi:hypothetical protein
VPALWDWYTSRKSGLRAAVYDSDHITVTKEPPLPFNPAIYDHLELMRVLYGRWAKRVAEQAPAAGSGPADHEASTSAAWLLDRAGWIAEQPFVEVLMVHLREMENRGRALAPWQATRHGLPIPCPKCERLSLVLYGGEDWVTCTASDCDEIIGWFRYERLGKAILGLHGMG